MTCLLIVLAACLIPARADATSGKDRCKGGSDQGTISAGCETVSTAAPEPATPGPAGDPDCRWVPLSWTSLNGITLGVTPDTQIGDAWRYYPGPAGRASREATDGSVELGEIRVGCDSGNGRIRFVGDPDPEEPDPVRVSIDRATRAVPVPEPAFNPALDVGGVVHLGMWLAVARTDPIQVTASGRGTSVTTTATLAATTWDMGDGNVVTCAGGGTPIDPASPAWESAAEGPCGHTYTRPSGERPYPITATTTWTVAWTATDGRAGTAPDVVRSSTFAYEVREIQTVGRGN